jgi:pimeloyl-ACP methyl ester carboxylesterase
LECWPDIPIHVLAGKDDRFFPIEFQRRVARERLGKELEEIPGGHLVALSNAEGLVERLVTYEKC